MLTDRERLRATWAALHGAESSLMAAALRGRRDEIVRLRTGAGLEPADFTLLARLGYGLPREGFGVDEYLVRYPFGDRSRLTAAVDRLVAAGVVEPLHGRCRLGRHGRDLLGAYEAIVATGASGIDLPSLTLDDLGFLLGTERAIVDAVVARAIADGAVIVAHRRSAHLPDLADLALWHHWQLAWTLVAAEEDAEQAVHKSHDAGLSPLGWFLRRQMWLGRFPSRTVPDLVAIAERYAPLPDGDRSVMLAARELGAVGWVEPAGDGWHLTPGGLRRAEQLERITEDGFLAWWPALDDVSADRLLAVATQLREDLARPA